MNLLLLVLGLAIAAMGVSGIFTIRERGMAWYCARANVPLGLGLAALNAWMLLR